MNDQQREQAEIKLITDLGAEFSGNGCFGRFAIWGSHPDVKSGTLQVLWTHDDVALLQQIAKEKIGKELEPKRLGKK